jgi:hypothetical protein
MLLHVCTIADRVRRCFHRLVILQGIVANFGNIFYVLLSSRFPAQHSQVSTPSCADIDSRLHIGRDKLPIVVRTAPNLVKGVILLRVFISVGVRIGENVVKLLEDISPRAGGAALRPLQLNLRPCFTPMLPVTGGFPSKHIMGGGRRQGVFLGRWLRLAHAAHSQGRSACLKGAINRRG